MKRIICFVLVFVSLCSLAFAEDGVFVPSYSVFMDRLSEKLEVTNSELSEKFVAKYKQGGEWISPDSRVYLSGNKPMVKVRGKAGFLDSFRVEQAKDYLSSYETEFKQLILDGATSICVDINTETLFDDIYYDYVVDSPAGYISMYYNSGVYVFNLAKSSSDITFEIYLSLYEAQ